MQKTIKEQLEELNLKLKEADSQEEREDIKAERRKKKYGRTISKQTD